MPMVTEVVEYWVDGRKVTTLDALLRIVGAKSNKEIDDVRACLAQSKPYKVHRIKQVYGIPAIRTGALLHDPCIHRLG